MPVISMGDAARKWRWFNATMGRRPTVLITLRPPLHAASIATLARHAGFSVVMEANGHLDAAIIEDGSAVPDAPVVIALGAGGRVRVDLRLETGFVFVDHAHQIVDLLNALLTQEPAESPQ